MWTCCFLASGGSIYSHEKWRFSWKGTIRQYLRIIVPTYVIRLVPAYIRCVYISLSLRFETFATEREQKENKKKVSGMPSLGRRCETVFGLRQIHWYFTHPHPILSHVSFAFLPFLSDFVRQSYERVLLDSLMMGFMMPV